MCHRPLVLLALCPGCIFISKAQYEADHEALYGETGGDTASECDAPVDRADLHVSGLIDATEADAAIYGGDGYRGLGRGLAALGDLDGDGLDDLGLGFFTGVMVLFEAPASEMVVFDEGSFSLEGAVQYYGYVSEAGFRSLAAGDVDGDGIADLVLGADLGPSAGVYLAPGPIDPSAGAETSTVLETPLLSDSGSVFWQAVLPGDLNTDGGAELLVAMSGGGEGTVALVSGADLGEGCDELSACGAAIFDSGEDLLYAVVDSAQDTSGDGVPDLLVGASHAGIGDGAVWLLDGAELGAELGGGKLVLAAEDALLLGDNTVSGGYVGGLGSSVAGVGDVDGDGYPDLLVAAPSGGIGAAILVLDRGEHQVKLLEPEEPKPGSKNFAETVAAAGDVNGDCLSDLLVTGRAYQDDDTGALFLYLGGADIAAADTVESDRALQIDMPTDVDTSLSQNAAAAGDPDGDGYGDLLISVDTWEVYGEPAQQGVVWFLRGGP